MTEAFDPLWLKVSRMEQRLEKIKHDFEDVGRQLQLIHSILAKVDKTLDRARETQQSR